MDPSNFNHIIKESYIHFEFPVVGYGSDTYMTSTKKHLQKLIHYLKKVMLFVILTITLKLYRTRQGIGLQPKHVSALYTKIQISYHMFPFFTNRHSTSASRSCFVSY
jgi:hypothetical protein